MDLKTASINLETNDVNKKPLYAIIYIEKSYLLLTVTQVGIDERATQTSWPDYWISNLDNLARFFYNFEGTSRNVWKLQSSQYLLSWFCWKWYQNSDFLQSFKLRNWNIAVWLWFGRLCTSISSINKYPSLTFITIRIV